MAHVQVRRALLAVSLLACGLMTASGARAQAAPPPSRPPLPKPVPAPDPALGAAQAWFEALPEEARRGIQADLIWTGHFTGTASGGFGPLTFRAINAFTGRSGPAADGRLDEASRRTLALTASGARQAAGFKVQRDPASGVRIGVPETLLPRREASPSGGSRWRSADGRATLDTRLGAPGDTLALAFERAVAPSPERRITYKLLRPDFAVVTGETAGGRFYTRWAEGPAGLRGFSLGYDKALADPFDRLAIAVASSFEPFPAEAPVAAAALPGLASPPADPAPGAPGRASTGLVVADGLVLTAAAASACRRASAGGRAGQVLLADEGSGLLLLRAEGVRAVPPRLRAGAPGEGERLVAVAQGPGGALAAPAEPAGSGLVRAPLQPGGAGAPLFDRGGGLAGVVVSDPGTSVLVAGVAPARAYRVAGADAVAAFLAKAGVTLPAAPGAGNLTTGEVAQAAAAGVVPVACQP